MPQRGATDGYDSIPGYNYGVMAANIYEDRNTLIPEVSNTFTLEFWVNPGPYTLSIHGESNNGNMGMHGQRFAWYPARGGTSNAGIGISVGSNGISVYEHGLTEYASHFPPLLVWEGAVSGWTHIAVVFENKQPRLYVNGVLVRTGITSLRTNIHPSTFCPGGYWSNAVLTKLDEVRVWDVARTAAEILASMNTEVSAASEHLLAYWPLNEGSGNVLQDVTGHGYNVQLSNGSSPIAWWDSGPQNLAHVMFNSYRYGFNGKEKSNEIYGEGNAYDFGARIYDPRLGRWLSTDPLQKKYPDWSPYTSSMNSPLKLMDIEGKDVGVAIVGSNINFNSTIFVTGPGASDIAQKATTAFNTLSNSALSTRTHTTTEGKCYDVHFQVHYVAVDPTNPKDPNYATYQQTLNAKVGTNGNNIISTEEKGSENLVMTSSGRTRSQAGFSSNTDYNTKLVVWGISPTGVELTKTERAVVDPAGNKAYVYTGANGPTAVHETFHLFGLGDRYIESMTLYLTTTIEGKTTVEIIPNAKWHQKGFKNDLMSNNSMTNVNQIHIDNLAKAALDKQAATGTNTFVIGQNVDTSNNRNGTPDPTPSSGYSIKPPKNK